MQFIIWTGIAVLGLITLSAAGMVFFHIVGEFRHSARVAPATEPSRPVSRRGNLRKVDVDTLKDRPPARRAA